MLISPNEKSTIIFPMRKVTLLPFKVSTLSEKKTTKMPKRQAVSQQLLARFKPRLAKAGEFIPATATQAPAVNVNFRPIRSAIAPLMIEPNIASTWIIEFQRASHSDGTTCLAPICSPLECLVDKTRQHASQHAFQVHCLVVSLGATYWNEGIATTKLTMIKSNP